MKKNCITALAVLCVFASAFLSAKTNADKPAVDQILNEANLLYLDGKYSKSVEKVNDALKLCEESGIIPENVQLMSEAAYNAWLDEILKTKDVDSYTSLCQILKLHPFKVSDQIRKRLDDIYQSEQADLYLQRNKAADDLDHTGWMKYDEKLQSLTKMQTDLLEALNGYKTLPELRQEEQAIKDAKRTVVLQRLLYVLVVICAMALIALIAILLFNNSKRKKIAKNFAVMMNVVALLNREKGEQLPDNRDPSASPSDKSVSDDILPANKDFLDLEKECSTLGSKIDRVTGRKNNSRKVSELVYKMAEKFHVSEATALVYFCAAMVYDAGFLSIGSSVFEAEHLTVKERYWIRDHVRQAQKYFDFVPEKYLPVFLDAAEYHHENLDGSGYMDGITEKDIPLVARMIHTAESYTSLINRRVYHKIMDRDSAIEEMKRRPGVYDPKTLEILEEIV